MEWLIFIVITIVIINICVICADKFTITISITQHKKVSVLLNNKNANRRPRAPAMRTPYTRTPMAL